MISMVIVFVFFFSSRRRHTRLQGDWSSDVCSSDLLTKPHHHQAAPMQIFVKGKNLRVTDPLRQYAEEKIGHLDHYIDHGILDAHVTLRTERNDQIVDVVLNLRHFLIKAEEGSSTMYAS